MLVRFFMGLSLALSLLPSVFANAPNEKAMRSFWHPMYHGQRLAYCASDNSRCGLKIADDYCKMMGYDFATQQIIAPNVGLTNFLGTSIRCKGWECNGFMTITCAIYLKHSPPKSYYYTEKKFVYPRYYQYRVDYCYALDKGCGYQAANSFCKRKGFLNAKHWKKEAKIQASRHIGSESLCFGDSCNGFEEIICLR